jgi:hypothetical protein
MILGRSALAGPNQSISPTKTEETWHVSCERDRSILRSCSAHVVKMQHLIAWMAYGTSINVEAELTVHVTD